MAHLECSLSSHRKKTEVNEINSFSSLEPFIPLGAGDLVPISECHELGLFPDIISVPLFTPPIRAKMNWQNTSDHLLAQHK